MIPPGGCDQQADRGYRPLRTSNGGSALQNTDTTTTLSAPPVATTRCRESLLPRPELRRVPLAGEAIRQARLVRRRREDQRQSGNQGLAAGVTPTLLERGCSGARRACYPVVYWPRAGSARTGSSAVYPSRACVVWEAVDLDPLAAADVNIGFLAGAPPPPNPASASEICESP